MTKKLIINANDLRTERRGAYLAAYSGDKVVINHGAYPDGVFELSYRTRQACFSEEPQPVIEDKP